MITIRPKSSLFFTLFLLLVGCYTPTVERAIPTPQTQTIEPQANSPDPILYEGNDELLLEIAWASHPSTHYRSTVHVTVNNQFKFLGSRILNPSGQVEFLGQRPRGITRNYYELSSEEISLLIDQLKQLESVQSMPLIGDTAITVRLPSGKRIVCGNRDCPLKIRKLIEMIGIGLVFRDESYIRGEQRFIHSFSWFAWYGAIDQPAQVLGIYTESTRIENHYRVDTQYIGFGESHAQNWYVNEAVFEEIQDCLDTLESFPQSNSGSDADVFKVSYTPDGSTPLIRLDKYDPPDCLVLVMATLDESLEQVNPHATIEINPFDR